MFGSIFLAALFWVYYVIPNLAELFIQMRLKLPALTRGILQGANWLEVHAFVSLGSMLMVVLGIFLLVKLHPRSRQAAYSLAHRLPVSRIIVTASGMAFITEHLSLLINAGVDIVRSLGVLERSLADEYYRQRIAACGWRSIAARCWRRRCARSVVSHRWPCA